MLYLFWGLLNIALFIFFIIVCFKATKLIRESLGRFASLVFVFGLLSFMAHSNNKEDQYEPNSNEIKKWRFAPEDEIDAHSTEHIEVSLEKTLISEFDLGIKYGRNKETNLNVPVSAYSSTTGFVSGTTWKPLSIIVNSSENNSKFQYEVHGILEWKLLGTAVYSQSKTYSGFVLIK